MAYTLGMAEDRTQDNEERDAVREYLRRIGKKGGQNSIASLSDEERSRLGRKAAAARWGKQAENKSVGKKRAAKKRGRKKPGGKNRQT